jgi:hypothetical protein
LYSPFEIAVQPKGGELLYSFSLNQTTTNPIEGYQLNISTGALTKVTGSPFTAFTGEDGVFDQSGAYLFGQDGNTITAYQVSSDGTLTSFASILEGWGTQIAITDVP